MPEVVEQKILKKPTLKEIYEARKKAGQPATLRVAPAKKEPVKQSAKAKDFTMGGYPEGVPPGAQKTKWDYDSVTGKYLSGKTKEQKRKSLWDGYRKIHKKKRASTLNKNILQKTAR